MHIESRPSKQNDGEYDFFVSCDDTKGGLNECIGDLKKVSESLTILSRNSVDNADAGTCACMQVCVCVGVYYSILLSISYAKSKPESLPKITNMLYAFYCTV